MSFLRNWFKRFERPILDHPAVTSFREALGKTGLQKYERELSAVVRNSIFMYTAPPSEPGLPGGISRLGGLPDLPEGVEWPAAAGEPLGFLGQIDLAQVAPFDKEGLLPATGFLYFFFDGVTWGLSPDDKNHWRVIFHPGPGTALNERDPPPPSPRGRSFKECAVRFSAQETLPNERPAEIDIEEDNYSKLIEHLGAFTTHHQLLGHESLVQGDVKLECQLVSNGLYCGDASGYEDPRANQVRAGAKDWILLLQVDSDDNPNMMWGDLGRLYFCIRKQDLWERRFDLAWMIFQCH